MTLAFQRIFGILERWNNKQVMSSLRKPHELTGRPNTLTQLLFLIGVWKLALKFVRLEPDLMFAQIHKQIYS